MSKFNIGKIAMQLRLEKKILKIDVCRGICSIQTLTRLEDGQRMPDKFLTDRIFQRLGKKIQRYEIILSHSEYKIVELQMEINRLIQAGEYEKAYDYLENYPIPLKSGNLHKQFIMSKRAKIAEACNQRQEAGALYEKALTYSGFNIDKLEENKILDYVEIELLFKTATLLHHKEDKICYFIEDHLSDDYMELSPLIELYGMLMKNLALNSIKRGSEKEALAYVEKGINFLRKERVLNGFEDLLTIKGEHDSLTEKQLTAYRMLFAKGVLVNETGGSNECL